MTNLRLTGQYDERLLGSMGLQGPYYNWNRWYLPGIGRYLELDPIALRGGANGQYGPDWYSYGNGNPLRYTDRNGSFAGADDAAVGGAIFFGWLFYQGWRWAHPVPMPDPLPPQPAPQCSLNNPPPDPFRPAPDPTPPFPAWRPQHGPAPGGGCPPCIGPEEPPRVDTTHGHGARPGAHVHYSVWEQDPRTCICYYKRDRYACL